MLQSCAVPSGIQTDVTPRPPLAPPRASQRALPMFSCGMPVEIFPPPMFVVIQQTPHFSGSTQDEFHECVAAVPQLSPQRALPAPQHADFVLHVFDSYGLVGVLSSVQMPLQFTLSGATGLQAAYVYDCSSSTPFTVTVLLHVASIHACAVGPQAAHVANAYHTP